MNNISPEDLEMIQEFVEESKNNLLRVAPELAELELNPQDRELVVPVFRFMHTVKGACGFLGFPVLEAIARQAECLLGQVRDGQRNLTSDHLSLIREAISAARVVLDAIETSGSEGLELYPDLTERLRSATL